MDAILGVGDVELEDVLDGDVTGGGDPDLQAGNTVSQLRLSRQFVVRRVEQVEDLLVVQLDILHAHRDAALVDPLPLGLDLPKELDDAARDQAVRLHQGVGGRLRRQLRHQSALRVFHVLVSLHRVRLAATGLPVSENGRVEPIDDLPDVVPQLALLEDARLVVALAEDMVEVEQFVFLLALNVGLDLPILDL